MYDTMFESKIKQDFKCNFNRTFFNKRPDTFLLNLLKEKNLIFRGKQISRNVTTLSKWLQITSNKVFSSVIKLAGI